MQHTASRVALLSLLVVLAVAFYPSVAFDRVVAPEATLRYMAPWHLLWGPGPAPSPIAFAAATDLGPRLHGISRDGLDTALWNPWVGGGRVGWLASPAEGGAPLALLSAFLARQGNEWTALIALELGCAFLGTWWLLRRMGLDAWPAAAGAVAYAFSGAVASVWLDWRGSGAALGPGVCAFLLGSDRNACGRIARWSVGLVVTVMCGGPALPFLALALLFTVFPAGQGESSTRPWLAAAALPLAVALLLPTLWLARTGAEPDAATITPAVAAPLPGLRALVVPFPAGDPREMSATLHPALPPGLVGAGFVGAGTALLAVAGSLLGAGRAWKLWLGVLLVALVLCLAPAGVLERLSVVDRPLPVMALAVAALAAVAVDRLAGRAPKTWPTAVAVVLGAALVLELAPPALHRLPLATRDEETLASPLPPELLTDGRRAVALLGAMPPDVGQTLAVPDVRARSLAAEPAYARRVGWHAGGSVTAQQALSTSMAGLGARWILEPLPLRVVTGEIYAHIEVGESAPMTPIAGGLSRFRLDLPAGVTRLGLPASTREPQVVVLSRGDLDERLVPDEALAAESAVWHWYAVPRGWPAGEAELELDPSGLAEPGPLVVARDRSGLRLWEEHQGVRIWESERAAPFARLEPVAPGHEDSRPGRLTILDLEPQRVAVRSTGASPARLIVQLKYRPGLWHALVDGVPARLSQADGVWSAVALPAGAHEVVLSARLPAGVWAVWAAGLVALAGLALLGRQP